MNEVEPQNPNWLARANLSDEEELRRYLRDRDASCPACRYNLRGLTTSRCPECGCGLRLALRATEAFLRAWIFLALVTFAGAGISVIFYVILAKGPGWDNMSGLASVTFGFFLTGPLQAAAAIMFRRRFVRLPETMQWMAGTGALVAWAAALITFFNTA